MAQGLGGRLLKTAAGTSGLRLANIGLLFLSNILLTRILGVEGYGVYTYSMSWVLLLNIVATLGSQNLLVREVSANLTQQKWGLIRGLLQWSNTIVLIFSVAVAIVTGAIALAFRETANPQTLMTLWIALILVPLTAVTTLRQSAMRGFRHIVQGQLPENILQPIFFMVLVGATLVFGLKDLNPSWVMTLRVIAGACTFAIGAFLLVRVIPQPVKETKPQYASKEWLPSMLSMLFMAGAATLFTRSDAVMIGMLNGTAEVGLYAVALRGARFVVMSLQIGSTVLGPHVASLYAEGNIEKLQDLTTKSIRTIMAYALPVGLGLIVFGRWFLAIFGPEFKQAYLVLVILCIGQLVNAATGSVSLLLIMTHHERDNAIVTGTTAVLNGILNLVLIPQWGAQGAAIATATATIISNIWLALLVYKRLGIHCTVLGKLPFTPSRS